MPQAESRKVTDRRIRSLRPPKAPVDPWRPIDVLVEEERRPGGGRVPTVTVFLAGAECPFTCVFCDLWRHTLDGPTPAGAIPAQLRRALADSAGELEVCLRSTDELRPAAAPLPRPLSRPTLHLHPGRGAPPPSPTPLRPCLSPPSPGEGAEGGRGEGGRGGEGSRRRHNAHRSSQDDPLVGDLGNVADAWIKLYNASNYFEPRAVPPEDDPEIAGLLRPFAGTVVECHPRLVGRRCFELAERLEGRLQVAVGLETVHPEALARLNKGLHLATFDRAAAALAERGIELRAFVLVGAPFVPPAETVAWTVRSAAYAFEQGAVHVTLIPVRGGNGELDRLARDGLFTPPTLTQVEEALDRSLAVAGDRVVTVDGWDLERLDGCPRCRGERIARLERINLGGVPEAPVACPGSCAAG